ncbi:MAG: response regulator [Anaerolineae bacterium]|nr:response regulator [Anaerolineae bacterium]
MMTTTNPEHNGGAAILLVEDTAVQALRFKANLEENGCEVRWVENGRDGLQAARESFYDLIILDIELPDINGFEVCRRLKEDPAVAEIPVIMLTTRDRAEDALIGLNTGAVDYIPKDNFANLVLLETIKQMGLL